MKAVIKSLSVPDFKAKPKVVKRKDGHHLLNPEVFAPWQVAICLESDGPVSHAEVAKLTRLLVAAQPVDVRVRRLR